MQSQLNRLFSLWVVSLSCSVIRSREFRLFFGLPVSFVKKRLWKFIANWSSRQSQLLTYCGKASNSLQIKTKLRQTSGLHWLANGFPEVFRKTRRQFRYRSISISLHFINLLVIKSTNSETLFSSGRQGPTMQQ